MRRKREKKDMRQAECVGGVYEWGGGSSPEGETSRVRRAEEATMNHFSKKQGFMGRKS